MHNLGNSTRTFVANPQAQTRGFYHLSDVSPEHASVGLELRSRGWGMYSLRFADETRIDFLMRSQVVVNPDNFGQGEIYHMFFDNTDIPITEDMVGNDPFEKAVRQVMVMTTKTKQDMEKWLTHDNKRVRELAVSYLSSLLPTPSPDTTA